MGTLSPVTGHAKVTNGSAIVEVIGIVLTTLNCVQGAQVFLAGLGYFVGSDAPSDTTHFELERPYEGDTDLTGDITCSISAITPEMSQRIALSKQLRDYDARAVLIAENQAGLSYAYSSATAGDPGSGNLAFDSADLTAATVIRLNNADASGQTITDRINQWNPGDEITIRAVDGSARVTYLVTSTPAAEAGYREAGIDYVGKSGVLAAGSDTVVERIAKGPSGADGVDGIGIPAGGAAGQVLAKASIADYDTKWVNADYSGGPNPLIDGFRGGAISDELFELANGVNEFDLLKIDGVYYFAQDDKTTTQLRSASTIAGLATATPYAPVANGRYPTFYYDADTGTWHLWLWFAADLVTKHYTAPSFIGTYTLQEALPKNLSDVSVRKLSDGRFYAAYKDLTTATPDCGVLVADSPNGPWTNLGHCFSEMGRSSVHVAEEADPDIWEADGKTYLTFSSWDGLDGTKGQLPSITEIDRTTGKATRPAVVLVNPTQAWQQRNGQSKLFNAVFLREDGAPDRIYYSHNVSTSGVAAGWGYIEAGASPSDGRTDADDVFVDFQAANFDIATGTLPTLYGSAAVNTNGLVLSSSTGGAYGRLNLPDLEDFDISLTFNAAALPASGAFSLLMRASLRNTSQNPLVGIWLKNAGGVTTLYTEIHNNASTDASLLTWTTTIATGTDYEVLLRRRGNKITGYLDGGAEVTDTFYGPLSRLQEWSAGNQEGFSQAANQQFNGTIRSLRITSVPRVKGPASDEVVVVDSGTNANGSYRRYSDGTQDCWTSTTVTVAANSAFTDSASLTWPAAFSAAPIVEATANSNYSNAVGIAAANSITATTFKARAINTRGSPSNTAGTCVVGVRASGKWL